MKKNKHTLSNLNLVRKFPMPERSSDLNKAFWVEVLQDKNLDIQSLNDGSISVQQRSQELADNAKIIRDCDRLIAEINRELEDM